MIIRVTNIRGYLLHITKPKEEPMDYHAIIRSQYRAALAMIEQAIQKCPDALWDAAEDKTKFWHVAYHALFYTQLYLQDTEKDFRPWAKYRKEYHFIGQLPWPPHRAP